MTTELLLFWLAVVGDLLLLYYTGKVGLLAARRFLKGDTAGTVRYACSALALAVITGFFPWALVSGARDIGKLALLICIFTPFVVSMAKLWPSAKGWIARPPMLAADVLIVFMLLVFFASADWAWFWAAGILMAVAWIVARKLESRRPTAVLLDIKGETLSDPFGSKNIHPSADLSDPNDPSWGLGR